VRVTRLDTLRLEEFPNVLWVLVGTDEGPTGLGETLFGAAAAEAHVHETVAPYGLGQGPQLVDGHVAPPPGPGLGLESLPGLADRSDARMRAGALATTGGTTWRT